MSRSCGRGAASRMGAWGWEGGDLQYRLLIRQAYRLNVRWHWRSVGEPASASFKIDCCAQKPLLPGYNVCRAAPAAMHDKAHRSWRFSRRDDCRFSPFSKIDSAPPALFSIQRSETRIQRSENRAILRCAQEERAIRNPLRLYQSSGEWMRRHAARK